MTSYLLLILGFFALVIVNLLLALIEGVLLTLLRWYPFRQSMIIAIIMNIASGILNGILLIVLQHDPLIWLIISFVISIFVESLVMSYFKRKAILRNVSFALLVNLASYILMILPAYYIGTHP